MFEIKTWEEATKLTESQKIKIIVDVLVAISTRKNLFEMGNLSTTVYDIKSYKQFYKELSALISLVEYIVNSKHYKAFFDNK